MRVSLTRKLAQAASLDAGDRSMRDGRRKNWNEEDTRAAAAEFQRLWPRCEHQIEPEEVCFFCDGKSMQEAGSKP